MDTTIVKDEEVHKALIYRAETDEPYGTLKGRIEGTKHRIKATLASIAITSKSSAAQAKIEAEASPEYIKLINEHQGDCIDKEVMEAKRKTAELMISVWQTQNANRRAGNIT